MEINPFHNGHIHFIKEVRKIAKNNRIICIISTNFVQRGEVSVLNKKVKTELLLNYGVDLVLELPMVFANQGGYHFALNAINILKHFQVTDLCFGSESADKEHLTFLAHQKFTSQSFSDGIYSGLGNIKSNDILAISYIKAIDTLNANIDIQPIKRIDNNYNDTALNTPLASSTSIRNNLHDKTITNYLPLKSYEAINNIEQQKLIDLLKINSQIALDKNLQIFLSENNQLLGRINKQLAVKNYHSIAELASDLKDKNNSQYKYQRIILNTILLISQNEVLNEQYYRVLGINKECFDILKGVNGYFTSLKDNNNNIGMIEKRATKLYSLITSDNSYNEYDEKMIIK